MPASAEQNTVNVAYFSDVLCIWAYIAQIRLDQMRKDFAGQVELSCHYLSAFGDVHAKIERGWGGRGGFAGYREHVEGICQTYDFVSLHADTWTRTRPRSSLGCHLFLKGIELVQDRQPAQGPVSEPGRSLVEEAAWRMRLAFFRDGRDIACSDEQMAIAETLPLSLTDLERVLNDGSAHARLSVDFDLKEQLQIAGSPTFVFNDGRQKLYGNVGYRIIEANLQELLEAPTAGQASWC
jgi:predicted DsbA family dithiol-disulfide isomerase